MRTSRREFLKRSAIGFGAGMTAWNANRLFGQTASRPFFGPDEYKKIDSAKRTYHLSVGCKTVNESAELPTLWKEAGVTDLWLTAWLYGNDASARGEFDTAADKAFSLGMRPHLLSVPFGHPTVYEHGLGAFPTEWKPVERFSGYKGWGISCHAPADAQCVEANRHLAERFGPCDHFLDDDFRFADAPGTMGGCVCAECRAAYQKAAGLSDARWDELVADMKQNNDTPLVRAWVDYQCDTLTGIFRRIEAAAPEIDLGIMVMFMGSERAGIRLDDYRGKLFRVGEMMFSDRIYDSTKNKTAELFSVLFHRRFTSPGRSFSETTIFPDNALSKENMASKLATSTFADVRNTMFMCNIPADYWPFLAPRMKKEARFHEILAGTKPTGPFKHFWGKAARYIAGSDSSALDSYSLFLALGVPFEVCGELPTDGWTFLGDNDARSVERGEIASNGTRCIARSDSTTNRFEKIDETFDALFAFRRSILPELQSQKIPYVEEETPVVLAYYSDARAVLLWNIENTAKTITVRKGEQTTAVELPSLETALLTENADGTFSTY